jgi:hypothetical protein
LPLRQENLDWKFENNTLIVRYAKPPEILVEESAEREERKHLKVEKDVVCLVFSVHFLIG